MKTKQSVVSAELAKSLISNNMTKTIIASFVLALTVLPTVCEAAAPISQNTCINKNYSNLDKQGNPQKFEYCAGTMAVDSSETPMVGKDIDVTVTDLSTDSNPACKHIHSIYVNKSIEGYLNANKNGNKNGTFSFSSCLMPRLFQANASQKGVSLLIGSPNYYDPKIANQNLLVSRFKNQSDLRGLQRARLVARGVSIPGDDAVCSFKDDTGQKTWNKLRRNIKGYEGGSLNLATIKLMKSGTATCGQIIDSLRIPADIFPNGPATCSKATKMCTVPSIASNMKNPPNPILNVVMPWVTLNQSKYDALGSTFSIDQFLGTLADPYADELSLTSSSKNSIKVKYEQEVKEDN